MQLHEQYRPTTWGEVVGQDKALGKLATLRGRGLTGRAYWITGQSGTGKSTIARILAAEVAGEDYEEIDAEQLTPSRLSDLERSLSLRGLFGPGGRAIVINEAHGLKRAVVRQLLVMLERLPGHAVVIFTTTNDGQDMLFDGCDDTSPLLSRCIELPLARRDLAKPFAERAAAIAQKEGLNGKPIESYVRLLQRHKNNLRAALQEIEAGGMLD